MLRRRRTPHERTTGYPASSNRASSMHLVWELPSRLDPVVEVRATIEVLDRPRAAELWFWALQATFGAAGGAHLGLQWHPAHPGSTAVNFGGYDHGGRELPGSESPLPSALANANTRDFPWRPVHPYVLAIRRSGDGWEGSIDGIAVRTLWCGGREIVAPMVWTECFARCDAPPASVRWSALAVRTAAGATVAVDRARPNYQSVADGGCSTGRTAPAGDGVWTQTTGVARRT